MKLEIYEVATRLAREYGVPAAHVAAIIEVESNGIWHPCQIRFEGHYFDERLKGADRDRARKLGLANPKTGGVKNPRSQDARYALLDRAILFDRQAAIESTSWGVGQVMGAHWKALGFVSADALRLEALSGLEGQARLMMRYVRTFGLLDELEEGRWSAFARGYNGPGYRKNAYDTKMAEAAERHGGRVAAPDGMLRLGAKGAGVREVQSILVRAGYSVRVDGDFGPATRDAVRGLQKTLGLKIDGIVGPATRAAFAGYRVAPDEKVGAVQVTDLPAVQQAIAPIGAAAAIAAAKDTVTEAATQVGAVAGHLAGMPSLAGYAEAASSGLVAVASLIGVVAVVYAGWQWLQARKTYEGVPAL